MSAFIGQLRVELLLVLRDKGVLTFAIFFPLLTVVFFGYLNRGGRVGDVSYASFLIAGGVGMVVSSAAFENLGVTLARQRDESILKRLGGTPLRPWMLVGAKVLTAAVLILAQTLVMIALNVLLFGARITGSFGWGFVTLLLGVFSFAAMGLALAGLSRNTDVASAAARALSLPLQFLCGTLFPLEGLPPVLRRIAEALPLTYFVNAFRGAILVGGGLTEYTRDWLILLGCLAVALLVAAKSFRWG
ncbi:MAG: ABC transporter permease [Anaerolineales bacterium]|nr:ABC transporter permease [Anaerolineales bacterium]